MKFVKMLAVIWFCFFLTACTAMKPVNVQLNYYHDVNSANVPALNDEKVNISISEMHIIDERIDKKHIGSTDVPIYGTGIVEWVRNGIISLSEYGYTFPSSDGEESSSGLSLKVSVNRVSCRGAVMHMRCTVLLGIKFFSDQKLVKEESYYGTHLEDKAVFSAGYHHFGEEPVQYGLNQALEQCLVKFESDLREISDRRMSVNNVSEES